MAPANGTLAGAAEAGLRKRRRGAFGPLRGPAAAACGAPARRALDEEPAPAPEEEAPPAWEDACAPAGAGEVQVQVDLGGAGGAGAAAGAAARGRIPFAEQRQARLVHRVHVLCLLGRGLWAERWARDCLHQSFCLSLLPRSLHPPPGAPPGLGHLVPAVRWLASPGGAAAAAEAVGRQSGGLAGALPGELRAVFLVGLCRALGLPARLVCCLNPVPRHAAAARRDAEEAAGRPERAGEPWYWVEVLAGGGGGSGGSGGSGGGGRESGEACGGRWVHVDPCAAEVDQPGGVEEHPRALGRALLYVAGFFGEGGARDVTRRYSSRFSGADARQRDQQWWLATLSPLEAAEAAALAGARRAVHAPGTPGAAEGATGVAAREEAELRAKWKAEVERDWPKTLTAAKDHPAFCLLRHLSQHQTVRPGSRPAGKFVKGEPLYRREDVCQLRTRAAWVRQGRMVRPGEEPATYVEAGRGGSKARDQQGSEPAPEGGADPLVTTTSAGTPVFGDWQTQPWKPAAVEGGRVPRNKYGNIECPPFVPGLPEGTVHLKLPRIAQVCRDLGVDYALAMVGFERKQGRFFPAIEGVVVLREREPEVVGAYLKAEQVREYKALQARMRAAEAAWGELLRLALAERRVRLEFGGGGGGGGGGDGGGAVPVPGAAAQQPGAGVQQVPHQDGFLVETEEI